MVVMKEKKPVITCPCCGRSQGLADVEEVVMMLRRRPADGTYYEHVRRARVCRDCKVKVVIHPMPRRWRPVS